MPDTDQTGVDATMNSLGSAPATPPEPVTTPTPTPTPSAKPLPTFQTLTSDTDFQALVPREKRIVMQRWVQAMPESKELDPQTQQALINRAQSHFPDDSTPDALRMQPKDVNQFLGIPYKFGGNGKNGIDCSLFTQSLYARNGVPNLPRTAEAQWEAKNGQTVTSLNAIQPGDQLFFQGDRLGPNKASHTAYFAGFDTDQSGNRIPMMYAASSSAGAVVKQRLDTFLAHSGQSFLGAKRYPTFQGGQAQQPQQAAPAAPNSPSVLNQSNGAVSGMMAGRLAGGDTGQPAAPSKPGSFFPTQPPDIVGQQVASIHQSLANAPAGNQIPIPKATPATITYAQQQFTRPSIPLEHAVALASLPRDEWDSYLNYITPGGFTQSHYDAMIARAKQQGGDVASLMAQRNNALSDVGKAAILKKAAEFQQEMAGGKSAYPVSVAKAIGNAAATEVFSRADNRTANFGQWLADNQGNAVQRVAAGANEMDRTLLGVRPETAPPGGAVSAAIPNVSAGLQNLGIPGKAANLALGMGTPSNILLGKILGPAEALIGEKVAAPIAGKLMQASAAARAGGQMAVRSATPASTALATGAKVVEAAGHSVVPAAFAAPMAVDAVQAAKEGRWDDAAALALAAGAPFAVRPAVAGAAKLADAVSGVPKDMGAYQQWAAQAMSNPKESYTTRGNLLDSAQRMVAAGNANAMTLAKSLNVSPAVARSVLKHMKATEGEWNVAAPGNASPDAQASAQPNAPTAPTPQPETITALPPKQNADVASALATGTIRNASDLSSALQEHFQYPAKVADATAQAADAHANVWARVMGKTPEEWYGRLGVGSEQGQNVGAAGGEGVQVGPQTGQPYEFVGLHNTEKSPNMGERFGQHIEPAGRYLVDSEGGDHEPPIGWTKEQVRFENPLVVPWGDGYEAANSWKRVLSDQYGGKTGKALSDAIRKAGYDGIITTDAHGTSEIVDLRPAPTNGARAASASPAPLPGADTAVSSQTLTSGATEPLPAVSPSGVSLMRVSDIARDPDRFQYKVSVGAKGTSGELSGVPYNPALQGVLSVWRDPADGKTYVVNGHNRLGLAEENGVGQVPVQHINVPDESTARFVGALQNIAEGRGTAIDAAKLFRERGLTPDDLKAEGVSLKGKMAADGMALSRLPESLWRAVFRRELPIDRAVAIGDSGLNQGQQMALFALAEKKKITDPGVLRELGRFVQGSGETTRTENTLFGEESLRQSNAIEKAKLSDWLKGELSRDKRIFKPLADEARAQAAASHGNVINVSENRQIAENAQKVSEIFDRFAHQKGIIADALNDAAAKLAEGKTDEKAIKLLLKERVSSAVRSVLAGEEPSRAAGVQSSPEAAGHLSEPADTATTSLFQRGEPNSSDRVGTSTEKPRQKWRILSPDRESEVTVTDSPEMVSAARAQGYHPVPIQDDFAPSKASQPEGPGRLFQEPGNQTGPKGEPKASIEFTGDRHAVITALTNPDASSGIHELAHVFRRDLEEMAPHHEQYAADYQTAQEWAGAKDGKWDEAAEEKWARGFEQYMRDGKAPDGAPEGLARVFSLFRDWLTKIYQSIRGTSIDVDIPDEMRRVFDRQLHFEEPSEAGRAEPTATPTSDSLAGEPGAEPAQTGVRGEDAAPETPARETPTAEPPQKPGLGVAQRVQEARAEAGKQEPYEAGKGISPEGAITRGRDLIAQGTNAEQHLAMMEGRGKAVSSDDMAILRAHAEELGHVTESAEDNLQANPNDIRAKRAYDEAWKAENAWLRRIRPYATEWSRVGSAMQGETDLDTGIYRGSRSGIRRAFDKVQDRDMTPDEERTADGFAARIKALNDTVAAQAKQLDDLKSAQEAQQAKVRSVRQPTSGAKRPVSIPTDREGLAAYFARKSEAGTRMPSRTSGAINLPGGFTPEENAAIWKYAKDNYIDVYDVKTRKPMMGKDFGDVIGLVARDLGLKPEEVIGAFGGSKRASEITTAMYKSMHDRRVAVQQAQGWIESAGTPEYQKFLKSAWAFPKAALTFGHGTVGMVTHAGENIFTPPSWDSYWKNFGKQFSIFLSPKGDAIHEKMMQSIEQHPDYALKLQAGLKIDPYRVYDDYQAYSRLLGRVGGVIGKMGNKGNLGMDVLKKFRSDFFDSMWSNTPKDMQTLDWAKEVSNLANHASGAGDIGTGTIANVVKEGMFASSLEASRWARLVGDPVKTLKTFATWKTATPAQRAIAVVRVKRYAWMGATYLGALAANQGLLNQTHQKDKINFTDPSKSDFLRFKWGGKTHDPTGNMLAPLRLMAQLIQSTVKHDLRGFGGNAAVYARGKLAPPVGLATDAAFRQDAIGRPLPMADAKTKMRAAMNGKTAYTWGEYAATHVAPIPATGAIREVYEGLRENGVPHPTAIQVIKGLATWPAARTFAEEFVGDRVGNSPKVKGGVLPPRPAMPKAADMGMPTRKSMGFSRR